jgi:hypothetical protein
MKSGVVKVENHFSFSVFTSFCWSVLHNCGVNIVAEVSGIKGNSFLEEFNNGETDRRSDNG